MNIGADWELMQASRRLERLRGVNNFRMLCELDENRCLYVGCSHHDWAVAGAATQSGSGPPKPSHFAPHA
eukprot:2298353-Prymnesium_polylepis.1